MRLTDNPGLAAARTHSDGPLICLYILETDPERRAMGGASKWWLDKSLRALSREIEALGGALVLRRGAGAATLQQVIGEAGARAVFWNRRYDEAGMATDRDLKADLRAQGLHVASCNSALLTEPWQQKTGSGGYYRVFTPFWKSVRASYTAPPVSPKPTRLETLPGPASDSLDDWGLHPTRPDWAKHWGAYWTPGEAGAAARLQSFLDGPISAYDSDRNRPDVDHGTSKLSPHLAFGEIGPAQIWRSVRSRIDSGQADEAAAMVFLSEICWRDFAYVLLFHHPHLAAQNYNPAFDHMPWRADDADLIAWQKGLTGYPIVDAGMRQLWQTGWMHNRVRMIVASFLTKHLLLPWQQGEDWFWDTLVDADPASNSASWQWTAGSGADAAPYFRVFNPITQGEKFDETGAYVRQWVPELKHLPGKFLYKPWEADAVTLLKAGIRLGEIYPRPIVDHNEGRGRALAAYETLKQKRDAA